jgi:tryptophan-rich sensory protein
MRLYLLLLLCNRIWGQFSFLPAIERSTRFNEFSIPEGDLSAGDLSADDALAPLSSVEPIPQLPPDSPLTNLHEEDDPFAFEFLSPLADADQYEEDFLELRQRAPRNRTSPFLLRRQAGTVDEQLDAYFEFPRSRTGSITLELQSSSTSRNPRTIQWVNPDASTSESTLVGPDSLDVAMGVEPLLRLIGAALTGSAFSGMAVLATLRMLAPLYVCRRVLAHGVDMANDWYTGRYLRKTYTKLEQDYWHYYQLPAVLRSTARLSVQLGLSFLLGCMVEAMVGLRRHPCSLVKGITTTGAAAAGAAASSQTAVGTGYGSFLGCSFLWILATLAGSHALGRILAAWHDAFRLSVVPNPVSKTAKQRRRALLRPWNILEWMRDPDQVVKEILRTTSSSLDLKPFHPEPLLFPVTWMPFRLLQIVAVLREMRTPVRGNIMRRLLIQQVVFDEWYRALIKEKRVALGVGLICLYGVSTISLYWSVGSVNGLSALLMLPAVLASLVSIWSNGYIYIDRRNTKRLIKAQVDEMSSDNIM